MATKLQAIIEFVYNSGGVEQAQAALGKLSTAGKTIGQAISSGTAQASSAVSGLVSTSKALGQAWSDIATPVNQSLEIFQKVGQAAKQAYEFVSEGAQLTRTQEKFDALSNSIGTTADALLGELKTATRGTISDAQLMASATSIMSLGLADTSEETVRLASLVGKLGWDMNQVTLTLANQSTMRLDSLGLSVEDVTGRIQALKDAGYSADQAFKFAILEAGEEKVKLLGDAADTTAGKLKILETNAANFSDSFKMAFSEELITNINAAAGGVFETEQNASSLGETLAKIATNVSFLGFIRFAKEEIADLGDESKTAEGKISGMGGVVKELPPVLQSAEHGIKVTRDAVIAATTATDGWMASLNTVTTMTPQAIQAIHQLSAEIYQETSPAYAELQDKIYQTTTTQDMNAQSVRAANLAMSQWSETIPTVTGYIAKSAEAMDAFAASTGQYFMAAANAEGTTLDVNQALVESIAAAGGSAEEIGAAALALGTMSEAQVEAAMKAAELEIRIAGVRQAYLDGRISADELSGAIEQQIDIVNGMDMTVNTATGDVGLFGESMTTAAATSGTLQDKFNNFNLDAGIGATQAFIDKLNSIPRTVDVQVNVHGGEGAGTNYGGGGYQNLEGPGFAAGTDFIVPPGYPNDSYPVRVQSGERVRVTPAGQSSEGNTYNLYVTATDGGANVSREFNYMRAISNV